ncbi:MAG: porin [Bacteroidia bacterium]|nr:porin [Bacteroidia bacterium]
MNHIRITLTVSLLAATVAPLRAQEAFRISGLAEAYYAYAFTRPADLELPAFVYNFKRAEEFNVNVAILKGSYETDRVRAHVGLMSGNYAQYNLAAEPQELRMIYQADAGIRLAQGLWLDAGVMPSHIGAETVWTPDNLNLTRSLMADNSPYYETGAKLTWSGPAGLTVSALVLNGWQNIRETPGNRSKALGTQVVYAPHERVLINYSTFWGNEKPGSQPQFRTFHDLYAILLIGERLKVVAAADAGWERSADGTSWNRWTAGSFQARGQLAEQWHLAGRAEWYSDPQSVLTSVQGRSLEAIGASANLDFSPADQALLRIEGKVLRNRTPVFPAADGRLSRLFPVLTASAAVHF